MLERLRNEVINQKSGTILFWLTKLFSIRNEKFLQFGGHCLHFLMFEHFCDWTVAKKLIETVTSFLTYGDSGLVGKWRYLPECFICGPSHASCKPVFRSFVSGSVVILVLNFSFSLVYLFQNFFKIKKLACDWISFSPLSIPFIRQCFSCSGDVWDR